MPASFSISPLLDPVDLHVHWTNLLPGSMVLNVFYFLSLMWLMADGWWLCWLGADMALQLAVAEQNWTVLDKQELVQVQIGSGQVIKGGPLSYLAIIRSHFLNGRHVLHCMLFSNIVIFFRCVWLVSLVMLKEIRCNYGIIIKVFSRLLSKKITCFFLLSRILIFISLHRF